MIKIIILLLLILLIFCSGCISNSRCNNSDFNCCGEESDIPKHGETPFYKQCVEKGGVYVDSSSPNNVDESCQYDSCCLKTPPSEPFYDSWKSCDEINGIFTVNSGSDRYSCCCIHMDKEYGWIVEPWGDIIYK